MKVIRENDKKFEKRTIAVGVVAVIVLAVVLWFVFGRKPKEAAGTGDTASPENRTAKQTTPAQEQQVVEEPKPTPQQPTKSDPLLILVNKDNPIPDDYDFDLVSVWGDYEGDARAKTPLNDMIDAAEADGIDLILCSAYRTRTTSQRLYSQEVQAFVNRGYTQQEATEEAARWVAPPGTSEHHTGLAFDLVTPSYQTLDHDFQYTEAAKWMKAHSAEYGFVLRFPEDKQDITGITFEPWHFRYVGVAHAKAMAEQGLCLEEYLAQ